MNDTERLNWLQDRGRVKARKYGNQDDNFKWDRKSDVSLREAIDQASKTPREPINEVNPTIKPTTERASQKETSR